MEIDFSRATGTSQDPVSGFLTVQFEGWGGAGIDATLIAPAGFYAVPVDPGRDASGDIDPTQATSGLYFSKGGEQFFMPLADPRELLIIANGKPGDRGITSPSGAFYKVANDGTHKLFTTDAAGAPSGQPVYFEITPTAFRFVAPWGTMTFDQWGFRIEHHTGAHANIGWDGTSSVATLSAASIELDGPVTIGTAPTDQAVGAQVVQLLLGRLQVNALNGIPPVDAATAAAIVVLMQKSSVAL